MTTQLKHITLSLALACALSACGEEAPAASTSSSGGAAVATAPSTSPPTALAGTLPGTAAPAAADPSPATAPAAAPAAQQQLALKPAVDDKPPAVQAKGDPGATGGARAIKWEDLVPKDWRPDDILARYAQKTGKLEDNDPRVKKMVNELREAWLKAPAVPELNGIKVRIAGYVVPLDGDYGLEGVKTSEFLLVPYVGACIHVPPPPANQTLMVKARPEDATVRRYFDAVWVTGTLAVERASHELADTAYRLDALYIEPYEPSLKP
jgi:hypothetical protein